MEPFPQPVSPYPRLPYFLTSASSPPGLSSCSPAYLAGSPEIIAKYSRQVSDKAYRCSAGVLDGQICYDWGHICECYTMSFLSAVFILLNKLRAETLGLCFLKHLKGLVPLISVLSLAYGQRAQHWRSLCSSAPHFSCCWLPQLKRGLLMYFSFL